MFRSSTSRLHSSTMGCDSMNHSRRHLAGGVRTTLWVLWSAFILVQDDGSDHSAGISSAHATSHLLRSKVNAAMILEYSSLWKEIGNTRSESPCWSLRGKMS